MTAPMSPSPLDRTSNSDQPFASMSIDQKTGKLLLTGSTFRDWSYNKASSTKRVLLAGSSNNEEEQKLQAVRVASNIRGRIANFFFGISGKDGLLTNTLELEQYLIADIYNERGQLIEEGAYISTGSIARHLGAETTEKIKEKKQEVINAQTAESGRSSDTQAVTPLSASETSSDPEKPKNWTILTTRQVQAISNSAKKTLQARLTDKKESQKETLDRFQTQLKIASEKREQVIKAAGLPSDLDPEQEQSIQSILERPFYSENPAQATSFLDSVKKLASEGMSPEDKILILSKAADIYTSESTSRNAQDIVDSATTFVTEGMNTEQAIVVLEEISEVYKKDSDQAKNFLQSVKDLIPSDMSPDNQVTVLKIASSIYNKNKTIEKSFIYRLSGLITDNMNHQDQIKIFEKAAEIYQENPEEAQEKLRNGVNEITNIQKRSTASLSDLKTEEQTATLTKETEEQKTALLKETKEREAALKKETQEQEAAKAKEKADLEKKRAFTAKKNQEAANTIGLPFDRLSVTQQSKFLETISKVARRNPEKIQEIIESTRQLTEVVGSINADDRIGILEAVSRVYEYNGAQGKIITKNCRELFINPNRSAESLIQVLDLVSKLYNRDKTYAEEFLKLAKSLTDGMRDDDQIELLKKAVQIYVDSQKPEGTKKIITSAGNLFTQGMNTNQKVQLLRLANQVYSREPQNAENFLKSAKDLIPRNMNEAEQIEVLEKANVIYQEDPKQTKTTLQKKLKGKLREIIERKAAEERKRTGESLPFSTLDTKGLTEEFTSDITEKLNSAENAVKKAEEKLKKAQENLEKAKHVEIDLAEYEKALRPFIGDEVRVEESPTREEFMRVLERFMEADDLEEQLGESATSTKATYERIIEPILNAEEDIEICKKNVEIATNNLETLKQQMRPDDLVEYERKSTIKNIKNIADHFDNDFRRLYKGINFSEVDIELMKNFLQAIELEDPSTYKYLETKKFLLNLRAMQSKKRANEAGYTEEERSLFKTTIEVRKAQAVALEKTFELGHLYPRLDSETIQKDHPKTFARIKAWEESLKKLESAKNTFVEAEQSLLSAQVECEEYLLASPHQQLLRDPNQEIDQLDPKTRTEWTEKVLALIEARAIKKEVEAEVDNAIQATLQSGKSLAPDDLSILYKEKSAQESIRGRIQTLKEEITTASKKFNEAQAAIERFQTPEVHRRLEKFLHAKAAAAADLLALEHVDDRDTDYEFLSVLIQDLNEKYNHWIRTESSSKEARVLSDKISLTSFTISQLLNSLDLNSNENLAAYIQLFDSFSEV